MFALTESMSYYLCPHYVDMRKGIYSLYQLVKTDMKRNPLSGEVFLFLGRNRSLIKILHWEDGGFVCIRKSWNGAPLKSPDLTLQTMSLR
jgi:IS66 Orf2 like protein.